jgi:two-component system, chemotaxis family, protein-glutamate methylesterase/glutaminase
MAGHDIIVIGGSAGSVEALCTVLAGLPSDLPAAVCVVLHQSAYSPNRRPEIFSRASPLPVVLAEPGMRLRPGTVYLSVQDMHMLIERSATAELGVIRLVRGPKENRSRPAVDPLFRSAALAFGRRVIGVILSGALDDGTSGLWVIKDRGGISVVQDPVDAAVSSMPSHAIEEVGADRIAPAAELGALLGELARTAVTGSLEAAGDRGRGDSRTGTVPEDELVREVKIVALDDDAHDREDRYGVPSRFACPDCGGVLWSTRHGAGPLYFRCETGHAYAAATLAEAQSEAIEGAMWAALRALEDKAELARLRGGLARERGLDAHARQFDVQLEAAQEHAAAVRQLLRMDGGSGIRPSVPGRQEGLSDQGGDKPASRGSPVQYTGRKASG